MKSKLMALILTLGLPMGAMAQGIECSKDDRPMDGNFESLSLVKEGKTYNLVHKIITAGFGIPVETKERILLKNLKCNVVGLSAFCLESPTDGRNAHQYSSLKVNYVDAEFEVSDLHQTNATQIPPYVKFQLYSDRLSAEDQSTYEFTVQHRFGGCKNI